jgi:NAD(P)-dependent dehydrogenase (short-subunit alcohol dehydrogenase family)
MNNVEGKVAFITGGASGIGFGIARAFAEAGVKVILGSRNGQALREATSRLTDIFDTPVHAVEIDVTDREVVRRAAQEANEVFGRIDILCNNAGVNLFGPMDEATYDDWDWLISVNLYGVINTLVSFLPYIKAHGQGGHVVNVASMGSFIPGGAVGIYTTTKFAVRGLSECLRLSLARHRIGVSLLCPGLTQSRIYDSARHRPTALRDTAFPARDEQLQRLAEIHSKGMDPVEVGRVTLEGVRHNRFYIFSHPEFREEVAEHSREILDSFFEGEPDPERMVFEASRREAKQAALKAARELGQ